jgi:hypothetical protein
MAEITSDELRNIIANNPSQARELLSLYIEDSQSLDIAARFIEQNASTLHGIFDAGDGYEHLAQAINEHRSLVITDLPTLLTDTNLADLRDVVMGAPESAIGALKFEGIGFNEQQLLSANVARDLLVVRSDAGVSNLAVLRELSDNPAAYQAALELSTKLGNAGTVAGLEITIDPTVENVVLEALEKMDFDAVIDVSTARSVIRAARNADRDSSVSSCMDVDMGRIASIAKGESAEYANSWLGYDRDNEGFVDRAIVEGIVAPTIKNITENGCAVAHR